MVTDEDACDLELDLELCLGIRPKGGNKSLDNGGHGRDRVADRSQRCENGREMSIAWGIGVDPPPQIRFDCDEHSAEFRQKSCCSEVDDLLEFHQRVRNMSAKTAAASVELLHVAGYVSPASSALPRLVSDETGRLASASVDAEPRKGVVYLQYGVDQQRKRELHVQKRQAERKKRKLLLVGEQKQHKLLDTSKPFPGSLETQKSEKDYDIEDQDEGTSEGLLERKSSKSSLASHLEKMEEKQAIMQDERTQFKDFQRASQREQYRAMTDKEGMQGFKPKEHDEAKRPTESSSDHKSSQVTEEPNKLETAQWIQKFHELRKMMNPVDSSSQNKIPASDVTSDVCPSISEKHFRNGEQVHASPKKLEISVDDHKKDVRNNGLNSKDLKLLKDEISARNESQDSPVAGLHVEAATAPFSLPTTASFIHNPFSLPMYFSSVNGVSYPVPYFIPYLAARTYGESSFTSYQLPTLPAGGTPFQMAASQTTSSCQTPVLQPTPVRCPVVSRTKQSDSPGRSRQQERCSQGAAAFLPKETQTRFPSKPPQSGAISSESRGMSWLDQADSHALSGTTSGVPEEAAASEPAHSGKSSSSSGVYQSAHGETVESCPSKSAGEMNDQANQRTDQETTTETGGVGRNCNQESTHKGIPSTVAPFVSTTVNGNTITGVLYTYSKGEVKICCKCHGLYMNAREFVIHAGGVDSPHPERSILVNLFSFTDPSPAVQD
ncbi:hypothetical protein O6H91_22G008400 [Diphasiastrum complanatum]|uniref:Uncharacterized protein n=1 Tax=Diphasiastrum complanatum TaxID=34168 RepID=A0ACC2ACN9_DIPCM|nr:hypothetical protein O6H91_22G008400 [Diphasiastrum complanatum]